MLFKIRSQRKTYYGPMHPIRLKAVTERIRHAKGLLISTHLSILTFLEI